MRLQLSIKDPGPLGRLQDDFERLFPREPTEIELERRGYKAKIYEDHMVVAVRLNPRGEDDAFLPSSIGLGKPPGSTLWCCQGWVDANLTQWTHGDDARPIEEAMVEVTRHIRALVIQAIAQMGIEWQEPATVIQKFLGDDAADIAPLLVPRERKPLRISIGIEQYKMDALYDEFMEGKPLAPLSEEITTHALATGLFAHTEYEGVHATAMVNAKDETRRPMPSVVKVEKEHWRYESYLNCFQARWYANVAEWTRKDSDQPNEARLAAVLDHLRPFAWQCIAQIAVETGAAPEAIRAFVEAGPSLPAPLEKRTLRPRIKRREPVERVARPEPQTLNVQVTFPRLDSPAEVLATRERIFDVLAPAARKHKLGKLDGTEGGDDYYVVGFRVRDMEKAEGLLRQALLDAGYADERIGLFAG